MTKFTQNVVAVFAQSTNAITKFTQNTSAVAGFAQNVVAIFAQNTNAVAGFFQSKNSAQNESIKIKFISANSLKNSTPPPFISRF